MMRRRQFMVAASAGTLALPLIAAAQEQGRTYRIAIVDPTGRAADIGEHNPLGLAVPADLLARADEVLE
jgi:hypothetical protein